jgi:hypothetical protein
MRKLWRFSPHIFIRRTPVLADEPGRIQPSVGVGAVTGSDERRCKLAHFEM